MYRSFLIFKFSFSKPTPTIDMFTLCESYQNNDYATCITIARVAAEHEMSEPNCQNVTNNTNNNEFDSAVRKYYTICQKVRSMLLFKDCHILFKKMLFLVH